jgi:TolB-like protein/DNA-binding winged helix-turn-helix (wHTH) protein/Flp pilus assembly protein TadD
MNDAVRYRVADLTVDVGRGRVLREDMEIPLPRLSFELLLVLIRHAPNLLSVDALMDKVWTGVVVSPETVSQRVKLLRDALKDDPKAPRYIGGLRGRGYQLIAPVVILGPEPPSLPMDGTATVTDQAALPPLTPPAETTSEDSPSSKQRVAHNTLRYWIGALLLLASISAAYFALTRGRGSETPQARFAPPPHSVAVLSFVNMSGDPQQEYFGDGLSEELSNSLARIKELQVAARTSSFAFKGKAVDIPTVGRKLNVGAVLEGSIRKMGARVRITAQLIDATSGFHLWSQTYDRDLSDVFRVQSEIAMAVSGAMSITLLANEQKLLAPGSTRNAQAFDAYLRGRFAEAIQDEPSLRAAIAALDEAVALDPQYAQAIAFRADVMSQVAGMYTKDPTERDRMMTIARSDAQHAVQIAPQSALAWSTLGTLLSLTDPNYAQADFAYRRSLDLEPGNAEILHTYASYAAAFGRADALTAAKRAVNLDPLDLGAHANLGVAFYYLHQFTEARSAFQEALRLGTNRVTLNWLGMTELATAHAQTALQYCTDPESWVDQICLAIAYQKLGRRADADAMLHKAIQVQGDGSAYQYVEVYGAWGDIPRAMQWLRRAVQLRDPGLLAIKTDPFLDSLRKQPEFQQLVDRIGLPT